MVPGYGKQQVVLDRSKSARSGNLRQRIGRRFSRSHSKNSVCSKRHCHVACHWRQSCLGSFRYDPAAVLKHLLDYVNFCRSLPDQRNLRVRGEPFYGEHAHLTWYRCPATHNWVSLLDLNAFRFAFELRNSMVLIYSVRSKNPPCSKI